MINAMLVGGPLKCVTDRVPKLIKPPSSLALQRVMQRWLFVGRVEFFRTRHSSDKGIRQSRSAKPSASNNSSDVASPGRQARAPRNRLKAKRRASNINNELINALKAKAEAEVRAAKAEAEAQAANLKATAEVQAAKLKADTEVEKNNLLHSLQWYTVALAQLRGRLNMRGLLGG